MLIEANEKIARLRCAADLLVSAEFWGENANDKLERVRHAAVKAGQFIETGPISEFEQLAAKERRSQTMFHWPLEFPESIVKRGGFDAFVGNPPFMGGTKITGSFSTLYRDYLVAFVAHDAKGRADLCTYFLLRNCELMCRMGVAGLLATNSISQGDSQEVGLGFLFSNGFSVPRAVYSIPWLGTATLEISQLWLRRGKWEGMFELDNAPVKGISSHLQAAESISSPPHALNANQGRSYLGSYIHGSGFLLSPEEAHALIDHNPQNARVLFPYHGGQDVNASPTQMAPRWVINFFDWPLFRDSDKLTGLPVAADFPDCLKIVQETVKPHRDAASKDVRSAPWWQYWRTRAELYAAIKNEDYVLVRARIANMHSVVWLPSKAVFNDKLVIFVACCFTVLQSNIHEAWARRYSSTLRTDMQYTPTDCFDTFPFPKDDVACERIGIAYHDFRSSLMLKIGEGLTTTYNRFHDPDVTSADIQKLRDLHVEMDQAVAAAYGWTDLKLGHGFHETKQGVRFTISEPARREVLQRLLKLNHERYAEEAKQGLHGKKGAAKKAATKEKAASKPAREAATLFNMGEDDE